MTAVGDVGEDFFRLICSRAGLTANASHRDKHGWDFYVEVPSAAPMKSDVLHQPEVECKIQVKTTTSKQRAHNANLTNLRRLATVPTAAFYAFVHVDDHGEVSDLYLVHVGRSLIYRVLKRVHYEENVKALEERAKRPALTIRYGDEERLESLDGHALKRKILSDIGPDFQEYINWKQAYLKSVGYDGGAGDISFTITGMENIHKLVNASLGFPEPVPVSNFRLVKSRFGQSERDAELDASGGILTLIKLDPPPQGMIAFWKDGLKAPWEFPVLVHFPMLWRKVPDSLFSIRAEGDFLDFLISPSKQSLQCTPKFDNDRRIELYALRGLLEFLNYLGKETWPICGAIGRERKTVVEFKVQSDSVFEVFTAELHTLECASDLIADFEVSAVTELSLRDVQKHGASIRELHALTSGEETVVSEVSFLMDEGHGVPSQAAVMLLREAQIGVHRLGAVVVIRGEVVWGNDGRCSVRSSDVTVENKVVLSGQYPWPGNIWQQEMHRIREKVEAGVLLVDFVPEWPDLFEEGDR